MKRWLRRAHHPRTEDATGEDGVDLVEFGEEEMSPTDRLMQLAPAKAASWEAEKARKSR